MQFKTLMSLRRHTVRYLQASRGGNRQSRMALHGSAVSRSMATRATKGDGAQSSCLMHRAATHTKYDKEHTTMNDKP